MKYRTCLTFVAAVSFAQGAEPWKIDTQDEWKSNLGSHDGVELKDGMAEPVAEKASLKSSLKRFAEKTSAKAITIEQSPQWLNWEKTKNIGTGSMQDAPVLLSLGEDNYWMFARFRAPKKEVEQADRKEVELEGFDGPVYATSDPHEFEAPGALKKNHKGYHAWQSRDMVNWVRHGSITENFSRWMTTAEYADGKFYFYYDFPNDQDPHVYVDEDPTDGEPGKNMGMALKDPSHGSDCAVIRDPEGKFHIIFENWDPINASKRSWDSPLAGHAVSPDGVTPFKILDQPPVDHRTNPTGKIGTYKHPHWVKEDPKNYKTNVAEYEIHEPTQEAFGDWASICIGGQYYLFGDYDKEHGAPMSTAWFTSSDINGEFKFCGNIGSGHPDPDVCFAEGKFYLATQQKMDFVSSGPWVEKVEVRVGVDVDNDAKIDEWADWQEVKEAYDYTPGFAKQVAKTPALLDLSGLPDGYGFQFEVRMTDTTENQSKPVLDAITVTFGD